MNCATQQNNKNCSIERIKVEKCFYKIPLESNECDTQWRQQSVEVLKALWARLLTEFMKENACIQQEIIVLVFLFSLLNEAIVKNHHNDLG